MSIQTSVYVDGRWTTRTMDIDHVIAQNREDPSSQKPNSSIGKRQQPPALGMLSLTLVRSPVVKWIIPARIRHKRKNDVVFIYESYIQIKEIVGDSDGKMRDVAIKADFDSPIRAARIFGKPRKYHMIKSQQKSNTSPRIPPQMLVLALESNKLVFLFALDQNGDRVKFVAYQRPLPMRHPGLEQLGEHIAVDPKSRAMAVAALEGSFSLYALSPVDEIKRKVEVDAKIQEDMFMPIKEEKHIDVEGVILKMEFLHPPEADQSKDHVILLLIVAKNKQSSLLWYEWDCSTGLVTVESKSPGQRLHPDEQLPLLLIPLTKSTAFMLVSEKRITVYRDILLGPAKSHVLLLSNQENAVESRSRKNPPLWTQWARAIRHNEHSRRQDNIYLCREDGFVQFLEIKDKPGHMLDTTHQAGWIDGNINTSFAAIDMGSKQYEDDSSDKDKFYPSCDMLIAGGDMSDGGTWIFNARQVADPNDVISNWTPLMDLAVMNGSSDIEGIPGLLASPSESVRNQTRFFASTGRGSKYGRITEIRYGIEAIRRSNLTVLDEVNGIDITQIWALSNADGSTFVLLSYPTQTSLYWMGDTSVHDLTDNSEYKLDYDAKTIAAGATAGLMVQITGTSIRTMMHKLGEDKMTAIVETESSEPSEPLCRQDSILTACVHCFDHAIAVLIVTRNEDGVYLRLDKFSVINSNKKQFSYKTSGDPLKVTNEPVSLYLERVKENEYLAIIGTLASTLQVFYADLDSGLTPVYEYTFGGQDSICDSITVLTTQPESIAVWKSATKRLIVCGLRNGDIEVLALHLGSLWLKTVDHLLDFCESLHVGTTTVVVTTDKTRTSRAIILCEQKLYSLEYHIDESNKAQVPGSINYIWLTDPVLPAFQHGKITAISQAAQSNKGSTQGLLFCVERSNIHMISLSTAREPCMVPRHMSIPGTPTKVIYSNRLRKIVVLYYNFIKPAVQRNGNYATANRPMLQFKIAIFNPDSECIGTDPDDNQGNGFDFTYEGEPGERFLGVIEWFPIDGNDVHHMLVVHTLLERPDPSQSHGRIWLFSVSKTRITPTKKPIETSSPVYALVPYGFNSLLYSCGRDLCLQTLDMNAGSSARGKWQNPIKHALGARGLHISAQESLVYVTTDQNGLLIFQVENNAISPYLSDEEGREGLHHLTVPERSLILTSQKVRTIAGLWQPSKDSVNNLTTTVFKAALPGSITRFCQIRRHQWHRPPILKTPTATASSESIIGSSTNGAIYQFEILDEHRWRLLRFIQNMAMRDPVICPFGDAFALRRQHLDCSPAIKEDLHVDGDILSRILERSSERRLKHMLEQAPYVSNRRGVPADFSSAAVRQERFAELAHSAGLEGEDGDNLLVNVIRWIRYLLQPAL